MDLTLRLSTEEATTLRKRAEADGVSEQAVALTAIRRFLEDDTRTEAIDSAVNEVKRRYASTLKRLGE